MTELLKAVVMGSYSEFLNGKEVSVELMGVRDHFPSPGERIMIYKHSIAAETDVPVPHSQQSHYIGIEGTVTEVGSEPTTSSAKHHSVVKARML